MPAPPTDRNLAEGYRYLAGFLHSAIERAFHHDARFPSMRNALSIGEDDTVLPIVTSLSREVFLQTPTMNEEAALALGATKWEMIRVAVLPYGGPGVIAAVMLGLGRALGETMAVALVLSPSAIISFALLQSQNPSTIAANIALSFPEAYGLGVNQLIATGLVLFAGVVMMVAGVTRSPMRIGMSPMMPVVGAVTR